MVLSSPQLPPKQSKALENAVYDEWKRSAVDSAKKRAVAQLVGYDAFKDMVSVAHLKPLGDPSTKQGGFSLSYASECVEMGLMQPGTDCYSCIVPFAGGHTVPCEVNRLGQRLERTEDHSTCLQDMRIPKHLNFQTSHEFEKAWRQCDNDGRIELLLNTDAETLRQIFRAEIKSMLLAEILLILTKIAPHRDAAKSNSPDASRCSVPKKMSPSDSTRMRQVAMVLKALATAGRFKLSLKLLPQTVRIAIPQLFSTIVITSQDILKPEQSHALAAQYGICLTGM